MKTDLVVFLQWVLGVQRYRWLTVRSVPHRGFYVMVSVRIRYGFRPPANLNPQLQDNEFAESATHMSACKGVRPNGINVQLWQLSFRCLLWRKPRRSLCLVSSCKGLDAGIYFRYVWNCWWSKRDRNINCLWSLNAHPMICSQYFKKHISCTKMHNW